ncbi:3-deoxy-7-phosphoheptulonate synthase class II [Streptomyces sp. ISL-22]|uniref:class II 3-deoxy-7-phosphoheptulonate synthase n=1 Tax=unclassified Streptomyces TaxID=2593676 RepID=UPI001BEB9DA5|nr:MULTISPECIES: 3-deoxy-7-phosphoheptulonate synthase class II [unclassified Streptomyces]MBT2417125.1 3-deoxy-7-phosphoheptulonate synthase class II [Streptomyces sp. ISL-24]MBT2435550.1 3-deoxy-7-phosphoheptulonate synthase class II [Streptomyces sp. ISL-22]
MTNAAVEGAVDRWRSLPAAQQPEWPDENRLREVTARLAAAPPLVFAEECDRLRERLGAVARGEAFLLHGGDCAETFDGVSAAAIEAKLRTLLQMAVVLTYAAAVPVVKIGRMAGQFAKPRSSPTETRDGLTLPVYRGDAVNDVAFTPAGRRPDPGRLLRTYDASANTLNLVRALTQGGYADLHQVHAWNRGFVGSSPAGRRYEALADEIERSLLFMRACGADPAGLRATEFFAGHEGLLLDYESALVRTDARTGRRYATSGHLLWIGERTRALDGAHVEFFAGIHNPVAVKIGPDTEPDEILAYARRLDPRGEPGRLSFVVRMGADRVRDRLPALVEKAAADGVRAAWVCDPMHGNTFTAPDGRKTRRFDDILDEVCGFFEVHRALGTHPGGIHVELTGSDVTECVGGGSELGLHDLPLRYETACDPRLNHGQSLDLAFRTAELLRTSRGSAG